MWTIYKYYEEGAPLELGDIDADNAHDALRKAIKLWPEKLDRSMPQNGLSVRRKQECADLAR